jgi:hypothetical protein
MKKVKKVLKLKKIIVPKKVKKKVVQKKVASKVVVKASTKVLVKQTLPAVVPSKVVAPIPSKVVAPMPVKVVVPVVKKLLYVEVTPDKYFVLCDGRKLKSGKELADTLQLITDDMFKYHVNDTKNDFANWINDVFGESDVAKKIRTIRNRMEMSVELYKHMFDKLDKSIKK